MDRLCLGFLRKPWYSSFQSDAAPIDSGSFPSREGVDERESFLMRMLARPQHSRPSPAVATASGVVDDAAAVMANPSQRKDTPCRPGLTIQADSILWGGVSGATGA